MAIGALGAILATPIILHSPWIPLSHELTHLNLTKGLHGVPSLLIKETEFVAASTMASLFCDFDEQHSLLSRKAEKGVQIVLLLGLVVFAWLMKVTASPTTWLVVVAIGLGMLTRANLMRRLALGMLGVSALYMGFIHHLIPVVSSLLFAVWCGFTMFTKHRTFSHSLIGWAIFSVASVQASSAVHLQSIGIATSLGYLFHMLADIPSGGVAIAWPIPISKKNGKWSSPRFGIHLIQTGGMIDHLIGYGCALVFLFLFLV
jgi:LexA-binding, inner membrane-associated putative hydrolase